MWWLLLLSFCLPLAAETIPYWVAPCTKPATGCEARDPELAAWALEAWQRASDGRLTLVRTEAEAKARIRVYWAGGIEGLYGEARPILVDGKRGAEVYVLPNLDGLGPQISAAGRADHLFRDAIVFLTCVHETGHALGLEHTAVFADILYSFRYGGDIPEYFGRFRRKLTGREDMQRVSPISAGDKRQLLALYAQ